MAKQPLLQSSHDPSEIILICCCSRNIYFYFVENFL